MSKKQSKPTSFTAGALLANGATSDSPATTTGISEVSGLLTPANGIRLGTVSTRSGAGAVPVTNSVCELTTSGIGQAITLADGVLGQLLTIVYRAEGAGTDTAVLTPTNRAGYSTITFNALGDTVTLLFTGAGAWYIVGVRGVTVV